ncbi:MAG: SRPBCC family protein [Chloroflexaceae bacterium]
MRYVGASVSGVLRAPVESVWDLVADPTRHPEIAGSGEVRAVTVPGGRMGPGVVFESQQRMRGLSYVTANRVVIWEPPYRIAWRVGFTFAPGVAQIWMFSLAPEASGTRIENGVVLPYALPNVFPFDLLHREIARREVSVIRPTFTRLASVLGTSPPAELVERLEAPVALTALLPSPWFQGGLWVGLGAALAGLLLRLRRALPR